MRKLGWLLVACVIATSGCCTSCGGPPIPFVMGRAPAESIVAQPAQAPPVQMIAAVD